MKNYRAYKTIMYFLSTVPFFSGILEVLMGISSQNFFGAGIPADLMANPFLQNQFRFIAVAWFGYAVFIWIFLTDVEKYALPLDVLNILMIAGGLTRVFSFAQFGFPENQFATIFLISAGVIEVLFVPFVIMMRRRIAKSQ
jgi:hypothetical protein